MAESNDRTRARDWYSISVASLRKGLMILVLVVALIGGSLVYQRWQYFADRGAAEEVIETATRMTIQLEERDDFENLRVQHIEAWEDLETARAELAAERYEAAYERGSSSLRTLEAILNGGGNAGGRSRFLRVEGSVEFRHGERGAWKRARMHDSLNPGDWVKTSADGTAEIRFGDGSTYTLRRNTMVHLSSISGSAESGGNQVADIAFGWVELNTTAGESTVKTPKAEARVRRDSEATVTYDRQRSRGSFAAFNGGLEVVSDSGERRQVASRQMVEQVDDRLSETRPLPERPQLVRPADNQEIDIQSSREARLDWEPVADAASYHLQVARNRLFASNIIEDSARPKTSARIGIRGEGIFYWRVAAISGEGLAGGWSEPWAFRVASLGGAGATGDKTPPLLELEELQTYGSLVLVNGRTELGATVTINGEPASVQLDGSFSKTIQMKQAGFAFVEIVATDVWNNATELKRRVFIEAF